MTKLVLIPLRNTAVLWPNIEAQSNSLKAVHGQRLCKEKLSSLALPGTSFLNILVDSYLGGLVKNGRKALFFVI